MKISVTIGEKCEHGIMWIRSTQLKGMELPCMRCATEATTWRPRPLVKRDQEEARRAVRTAVLIDGERLTVGQLEALFVETHPMGEDHKVVISPPTEDDEEPIRDEPTHPALVTSYDERE